jgi:hypothetical protein
MPRHPDWTILSLGLEYILDFLMISEQILPGVRVCVCVCVCESEREREREREREKVLVTL